uniref:Pentraxin family member n=1 Tax=Cricetulus griseus TaxID=10029 RepID=A0A8C2N6U5_CRIGR
MDKMLLLLGVSILLSEAFAQTGKKFRLQSGREIDLELFLFSYNTKDKDNELLIYKERIGEYGLYIGNLGAIVRGVEEFASPVHFCTSWESSSGIAEFWVNGKPWVKKGLKKGYTVKAQPSIILGQEQDKYGGGFDKSQSFVGEMGDLNMWDSVLTPEEIKSVYEGSWLKPNILDWQALDYEMNGYAVIRSYNKIS